MTNFWRVLFLSLLAAFPPLSTDMYLPAIPMLQERWGIGLFLANFTLIIYFGTFSLFLLVHGPLSDRVGRRPVLLAGIVLFILGTLGCAMSPGIWTLIAARAVQAAGAAAAAALGLALSKDYYQGAERQRILAIMGVIVGLAPMSAPTLGSLILQFASWRFIFTAQALVGAVALAGALLMTEPEFQRTTGGLGAVAGRYLVLLRNRRYMGYTMAFSVVNLPMFAFVAASADLYITHFGLSEQAYGLYFGANALGVMSGSFLCTRLTRHFNARQILIGSLVGMLLSAVALILLSGLPSPLALAAPMAVMGVFLGASRPISNYVVLEQVDRDVGAASSVLTFVIFLMGALGMAATSLNWADKQAVVGWLAIPSTVLPLAAVWLLSRGDAPAASSLPPPQGPPRSA
ncbi:MAG: multidrug effflux MFS transporter [Desulfovibrionaceae bacterium]